MTIDVRVLSILAMHSGISAAGKEWRSQEFVGETMEQYPKKVCFEVFNPGSAINIPSAGSNVRVEFYLESRCYKDKSGMDRWATAAKVSSISPIATIEPESTSEPVVHIGATEQHPTEENQVVDDLPF